METLFLDSEMLMFVFKYLSYYLSSLVHGEWNWADLTAYNYHHWHEGEPNSNDDLRYCAQIYPDSGDWDDTQCTKLRGYICKKRRSKILHVLVYLIITPKIIFISTIPVTVITKSIVFSPIITTNQVADTPTTIAPPTTTPSSNDKGKELNTMKTNFIPLTFLIVNEI